MRKMTKKEGKAFQKRWERVHEAEIKELRATTPITKLKQLASLMFSVDAFGWRDALAEGEEDIRERWNHLRTFYHV